MIRRVGKRASFRLRILWHVLRGRPLIYGWRFDVPPGLTVDADKNPRGWIAANLFERTDEAGTFDAAISVSPQTNHEKAE